MKKLILLFIFIVNHFSYSQLNCKSATFPDGSTTAKCFHQNGFISTEEQWDKDKRMGRVIGFNNSGEEIFNFTLRKFAGHATSSISYYENGQVKSVNYSDAPDGGIQFYKSTTQFDENGKQINFYETKSPFELKAPASPQPAPSQEKKAVKQEVMRCAVLCQDFFEIQNGTTHKIKVFVNTMSNYNIQQKSFILRPSEKIVFDTIFSAERNLQKSMYIVQIDTTYKKRKSRKTKIFSTTTENKSKNAKTWQWIILKE